MADYGKELRKRWRRLEVKVQRHPRVQAALRDGFHRYLNFVFRTTRWERIGFESWEADIARGVPRVLCCWHGRLSIVPYLRDWKDHSLAVLASEHADARIATAGMRRLGIRVIDLATSGDNTRALRDAVTVLRQGASLGVSVDGPLGPVHRTKPGALAIAALAGVEAVPCSWATSRTLTLRTWDSFKLPLPWSRGVLAVGDGFVPQKRMSPTEMNEACLRLDRLIDELDARCENHLAKRNRKRQ